MSEMTTICSWDVGIKNLAYCIIQKNKEEIKILDWNIVNISSQIVPKCESYKGSGDKCDNNATFTGCKNNLIYNYCGSHKKNYRPFNKDVDELFTDLKEEQSCTFIYPKKQTLCGKSAISEYNQETHFYFCLAHKNQHMKKVEKDRTLKSIRKVKCKDMKITEICETMYDKLNTIDSIKKVDYVYIENQPVLKNPMMKSIGIFLGGYFIGKKVADGIIKDVRFACPSNKLKVDEDNTFKVLSKSDDDYKIYSLTKELSVKYTKQLIKDDSKWLDHLETYKKKDDLCDAYLQGLFYITSNFV